METGIYFGEPRGIKTNESGEEVGFNTEVYAAHEVLLNLNEEFRELIHY